MCIFNNIIVLLFLPDFKFWSGFRSHGLVLAVTVTVCSGVKLPCCVQNTLVPSIHPPLHTLAVFLALGRRTCGTEVPFKTECSVLQYLMPALGSVTGLCVNHHLLQEAPLIRT